MSGVNTPEPSAREQPAIINAPTVESAPVVATDAAPSESTTADLVTPVEQAPHLEGKAPVAAAQVEGASTPAPVEGHAGLQEKETSAPVAVKEETFSETADEGPVPMDVDLKQEAPSALDDQSERGKGEVEGTLEPIKQPQQQEEQSDPGAITEKDVGGEGRPNGSNDALSRPGQEEEGSVHFSKEGKPDAIVSTAGPVQSTVDHKQSEGADQEAKGSQDEPASQASTSEAAATERAPALSPPSPHTASSATSSATPISAPVSTAENSSTPAMATDLQAAKTQGEQSLSAQAPVEAATQTSTAQPPRTPASAAAPAPPPAPAESSASGARRNSASHQSIEAQDKARQEEIMRLQRENEDMRLMWLSLPANDHITYYSDTEDDASSTASDVNGMAPIGTFGGLPFLPGHQSILGNGKRKRESWMLEEEQEGSDSADEAGEKEEMSEERRHRTGNRGNKLLKGSRWIRRGKLGLWTEAKNEKEMHDRFTTRVKAVQRAGVESLLYNAPGPKAIQDGGSSSRDMLEGSDRMLLKDSNSTKLMEENLNSTFLAPALLRPILSARALLESHTLRHTFRNPHIGALSKTALDLRESEGQLSRALGRCFGAMERISAYGESKENGELVVNGGESKYDDIDPQAIGVEGTSCTTDEINPAFVQLDKLFITKEGLPIPLGVGEGEEAQASEMQAILSVAQQRDVVRAALECLHELGSDSLEYVERLDEVRGRLEAVKRRRTQVWEALRFWAIKREGGGDEEEEAGREEAGAVETARLHPKAVSTAASTSRRRR